MPKQVWKLERFDGGKNNHSDPRDIADNELADIVNASVSHRGTIKCLGSFQDHDAGDIIGDTLTLSGYGLFSWSHDMTLGAATTYFSGTHTDSSSSDTIITDSNQIGTTGNTNDILIGATILNDTDGSTGTITDNAINPGNGDATITVDDLTGGTGNEFDQNDKYRIRPLDTGDDYIFVSSVDSDAEVLGYSIGNDKTRSSILDLGTGASSGLELSFFIADGVVRASDGSFSATCQNQWYGFIERFDIESSAKNASTKNTGVHMGWYAKTTALSKPTVGVYGLTAFTDTTYTGDSDDNVEYASSDKVPNTDPFRNWGNINAKHIVVSTDGSRQARMTDGNGSEDRIPTANNSGDWAGEAIRVHPSVGAGWNIYLQPSATDGNWEAEYYKIGTTFVYVGNQESNILDIDDHGNYYYTAGGLLMNAGKAIDVKVHATAPYDPQIIGGRAYIKKARVPDDWVLIADISLKDGVRPNLTDDYTAWTRYDATGANDAPSDQYAYVDLEPMENPSPWTYRAINGYKADENVTIGALGEGWKTAVVANRQAYVGNVKRTDADGNLKHEGDAMYKSMPGKYDIFPISRKILASVQDGDEIVKLEEYADRILQFKKKKMHLINVSQDVEFLEDTFMYKGVSHSCSVAKTDYGVAWANEQGAYLYNGQNVINLLEKNGTTVIDGWSNFITSAPQVGYSPKDRQILISSGVTNASNGDVYIFDIPTQSWVMGDSVLQNAQVKSNFTVDGNNDLLYMDASGDIRKWVSGTAVTRTATVINFKDVDFGQPSVRKKIYKVYMSYKGAPTSLTVKYSVNGDTDTEHNFYRITADGSSDKTNDDTTPLISVGTDDWVLAELRPVDRNTVKNVYSFQLRLAGTISTDFEINDISIVYRLKNIK